MSDTSFLGVEWQYRRRAAPHARSRPSRPYAPDNLVVKEFGSPLGRTVAEPLSTDSRPLRATAPHGTDVLHGVA